MRYDLLGSDDDDGSSPLDEDETAGLIPSHLTTRKELNQWEALNIERALEWTASRSLNVLNVPTLVELHRRMFDETWEWAGKYRQSEKSISPYHWSEVPRLVRDLVADTQVQYELSGKSPSELDELAARFHHRLVQIHPWPNGNGRHARLATDLLLRSWGRPAFSWGSASAGEGGSDPRQRYLKALRAADAGDYRLLMEFIRT